MYTNKSSYVCSGTGEHCRGKCDVAADPNLSRFVLKRFKCLGLGQAALAVRENESQHLGADVLQQREHPGLRLTTSNPGAAPSSASEGPTYLPPPPVFLAVKWQ